MEYHHTVRKCLAALSKCLTSLETFVNLSRQSINNTLKYFIKFCSTQGLNLNVAIMCSQAKMPKAVTQAFHKEGDCQNISTKIVGYLLTALLPRMV
jgi:hypothetical protein